MVLITVGDRGLAVGWRTEETRLSLDFQQRLMLSLGAGQLRAVVLVLIQL